MKAGRHLFLDLEDTVITPVLGSWAFCDPINTSKIRGFIEAWAPTTLNVFEKHVRPFLERDLGMPISLAPTEDEIISACCRQMKLHRERVDFSDMSAFWSKHQAFRLYVKDLAGSGVEGGPTVALVDDAVDDERFEWPALRVSGLVADVASLYECGKWSFFAG
jgi:hypothetical protein